jgi:23S rRNA pseudouridine1911/1915/1917 synthase
MAKARVLYEDNHLLALEKPACLPTVPDESGDESLLDWGKRWVAKKYSKPGAVFLGVIHRLDRPVSGVVLFARTSKAADRLSAQFRERTVQKTYLGVVDGVGLEGAGRVEQWLRKSSANNRVQPCAEQDEGARRAVTDWRVLEQRSGLTLLELKPETGRSHQLRVACQTLGAPLSGDLKYGALVPLEDKSIALHAARLSFDHPTLGERLEFTAPLPKRLHKKVSPWSGWSVL